MEKRRTSFIKERDEVSTFILGTGELRQAGCLGGGPVTGLLVHSYTPLWHRGMDERWLQDK